MSIYGSNSKELIPTIRHELSEVAQDIEDVLHAIGDAADDQAEELKAKARSALDRLHHIEQKTLIQLNTASELTGKFIHERPWPVIAATAVTAFAIGLLTQRRD
ncbi:DUF883 family protein [Alcaligenaceae bacterium CGII-47]|nr:DUF883 family protein [Alcaligenaceae bacterium CGII-47]